MKVLAALLLTIFLNGVVSQSTTLSHEDSSKNTTETPYTIKSVTHVTENNSGRTTGLPPQVMRNHTTTARQTRMRVKYMTTSSGLERTTPSLKDPLLEGHARPFLNPKDILLQEIHTLDEEASNAKIQDQVAQTLKAEAQRVRFNSHTTSTARSTTAKTNERVTNSEESAMKKLLEAEDMPYNEDLSDEEDEDDDSDDDYDDDDDDDDSDDDFMEDEEEVMTQCPDYCRCSGQYTAAAIATCNKLVDEQPFGPGIIHLVIENAGEIRLGPHALRSRGLQQLETITITDTKIIELDRTAFDGLENLSTVNLTRNGLQDIHPNIFQNNSQLSRLAITGNPLKHTQDSKVAKHDLFDAPLVTEFDFSNNGLTKLKRNAFAKMQNLVYVNLKGNRVKDIDSATFNQLESLVELDLSNNMLSEIPADLFDKNGVQTLRISGNNLTSLASIRAPELTVLDASNNRIKIIAKDDLAGMPLLDQLIVSSNGLKRIHQHAFMNLDQLTFLDVSVNKLSSWSEHHLKTNSMLQVLLMNDNIELQNLPVFKIVGSEYETSSIFRFECANCGLYNLEEDTFHAMPALTRLNLARNRLSEVIPGLFSRLTALRILDLSDNIIESLTNDMFKGAKSLTKISLAGNPLVKLQVTPFLVAPNLVKLDVSRCALERVWSEARSPLKSLRFLSVRKNLLRRITTEELKAMPKISGLDLSHNPLNCDDEFNSAIQWLTEHGVTPAETLRYSSYGSNDDYPESDGISQWTDLAKVICDGVDDGPPPRTITSNEKKLKTIFDELESPDDSLLKNDLDPDDDLLKLQLDHGITPSQEVEKAWSTQDQEYEDFVVLAQNPTNRPWYSSTLWSVIPIIILTLMILLLTANIAVYLAKRRGRGPVIRPPMMLRQGLIDNKNCGLVYKPLQEEIATPHMPKRSSFYSSSTFHYDKIVPESV